MGGRWAWLSWAAICLLWLGGAAQAAELRFITIDVAPWASQNPQTGRYEGFFVDVVQDMQRRTGHHIQITLHPFARIDRELQAGNHDCTILVTSPQRKDITVQGELVSGHMIGVLLRKGLKADTVQDLRGRTVSVLRGLGLGAAFDEDAAIGKSYDTDYLMGLRKVAHGRLDGVGGAIPTIRFLARQNDLLGHFGDVLVLTEVDLRLQCAKQSPRLADMPALNQAIRSMVEDGTMRRLKVEHDFE